MPFYGICAKYAVGHSVCVMNILSSVLKRLAEVVAFASDCSVDSARQQQKGRRKRKESRGSGSQRDLENSEMRVGKPVGSVQVCIHCTLYLYPSI